MVDLLVGQAHRGGREAGFLKVVGADVGPRSLLAERPDEGRRRHGHGVLVDLDILDTRIAGVLLGGALLSDAGALVGLELGIISQELFSILVFIAIFTTALVPVTMKWGIEWLDRSGELFYTDADLDVEPEA